MQNKKRRRVRRRHDALSFVVTSGRRQHQLLKPERVEDVLLEHLEAGLQGFRQAHLDAVTLPLVSMARPEEVILVEHLLRCHLGKGLVVVEALILQRFDAENNLHALLLHCWGRNPPRTHYTTLFPPDLQKVN